MNDLPTVDAGGDITRTPDQTVILEANSPDSIVTYNWQPAHTLDCANCQDPMMIAEVSADYTVEVTDANGCKNSDDVYVRLINTCREDIFIPNTFTPNFDGVNDKFYVRGNNIIGLRTFRIYDRWGNLVFETTDLNEGWDGMVKGHPADPAIFAYYVEPICANGRIIEIKGNVALIR